MRTSLLPNKPSNIFVRNIPMLMLCWLCFATTTCCPTQGSQPAKLHGSTDSSPEGVGDRVFCIDL